MVLTDVWFSAPAESENGQLVIVTGREKVDNFRLTRKLRERFEVKWTYDAAGCGMPPEALAEQMEQVEVVIKKAMEKDKLAIMTGIYTGAGAKMWVFYTRTAKVFGERLNEALAGFDLLPLDLYVEMDEEWEEYQEMLGLKLEEEDDDE